MATTTVIETSGARRTAPLCAICVTRPALVRTEVGGRLFRACVRCARRPAAGPLPTVHRKSEKHEIRERVTRHLRFNPGASAIEIREALDIEAHSRGADALAQYLSRGTRAGELTRVGSFPEFFYTLVARLH